MLVKRPTLFQENEFLFKNGVIAQKNLTKHSKKKLQKLAMIITPKAIFIQACENKNELINVGLPYIDKINSRLIYIVFLKYIFEFEF